MHLCARESLDCAVFTSESHFNHSQLDPVQCLGSANVFFSCHSPLVAGRGMAERGATLTKTLQAHVLSCRRFVCRGHSCQQMQEEGFRVSWSGKMLPPQVFSPIFSCKITEEKKKSSYYKKTTTPAYLLALCLRPCAEKKKTIHTLQRRVTARG